jgi:SOS-response transcriptional repressor LexA
MNISENRRIKLKEWFSSRSIPEGEKSYISQLINGKASFGEKAARRLEVTYCMPIGFLDSAENKTQEISLENDSDFPAIKKVNLRVSAGITGFGVEPITGEDSLIVFRADWYQSRKLKPENLLALKVSGMSMEPNLYDGDVVVMNTADTHLKDGEVFVFNLDGEVVIKRAVRDGGNWWLDSDNPDKTRFTRKACPDGICIPLGKVIHRQTERI